MRQEKFITRFRQALSRSTLAWAATCLVPWSGTVIAQVAGSTPIGMPATERSREAMGWSAKESILGRAIFNESGEMIGKVEDLIVDGARNVSFLIIGVGGFVGMGRHEVAVPASQIQVQGDRMVLPGASRTVLAGLPPFIYAPVTRSHSSIVARAERDMDDAKRKVASLQAQADTASGDRGLLLADRIAAIQQSQVAVEQTIAAMNAANGAAWKAVELEVGKASARLRRDVGRAPG